MANCTTYGPPTKTGGSVVDIFWNTEVIGKLYYVRSADENVGVSVVDIFWKTAVIGKLYY